jgi:excisionase family DNA binding protein
MQNHQATELLGDGLNTVRGAAAFLQVSVSQVYRLMELGLLEYTRIGRSRRIPRRALVELATRNLVTRRDV